VADALNLSIGIGPKVLLAGLIAAVVLAAFGFARCGEGRGKWLTRHVLGAVVVGLAALVVGTGLGIAVFCASADSGNLCGLGGVFGSGPLLAGIALAGHGWRGVVKAGAAR
jgi:hypothetical protein